MQKKNSSMPRDNQSYRKFNYCSKCERRIFDKRLLRCPHCNTQLRHSPRNGRNNNDDKNTKRIE